MVWHCGSLDKLINIKLFDLLFMTSRQMHLQEDTKFRVMRLIQEKPSLTQRELAEALGISLGGLNYCLRALIAKGLVKMHNFNQAENKMKYVYVLTPNGIKERSSLTYRFLERKLKEYEDLKAEIKVLKSETKMVNGNK